MIQKTLLYCLLCIIVLFIHSCDYLAIPDEPEYKNSIDTLNPDFIWPNAEIISPVYHTLSVDHITFIIEKKYDLSTLSYRVMGLHDDWRTTTESTIAYTFLNEGDYVLQLQEITDFGVIQKNNTEFDFTINAINGPALVLADKKTSPTSNIQLALLAEEVTNLKAVQVVITFNSSVLNFHEALKGDFLEQDADGQFFDVKRTGDTITISAARLGDGGVSGTGVLAELDFGSISSTQTYITVLNKSIMRTSSNAIININYFGETIVTSN